MKIKVCTFNLRCDTEKDGINSFTGRRELIRRELASLLEGLMQSLTDRQQQVLRLHFGMEDGICHSLEEIGGILGVSKERARQIEQQAMEKLRTMGADMGLEDFLN